MGVAMFLREIATCIANYINNFSGTGVADSRCSTRFARRLRA